MGTVSSTRKGFYRVYFPAFTFNETDKDILKVLCQERIREILLCIIELKTPTQYEISEKIGI